MELLADLIYRAAADFDGNADYIRNAVTELCARFPVAD